MGVVDEQRGQWSKTHYNQTFPYQGMSDSSVSVLADGTIISLTQNTYSQKPVVQGVDAKVYHVYQSGATGHKYDTDGTPLSTSTTTQTVDDYGSVLSSTVTLTDNIHSKTWTTVTTNNYQNDTSNGKWHLARLLDSTVTKTVTKTGTGQTAQTKKTAFTYDATTGLLATETVEPGHAKAVTTSRTRDAYGNVISTTTSAAGVPDRVNTSSYGAFGRFVIHTANALGHTASMVYTNGVRKRFVAFGVLD